MTSDERDNHEELIDECGNMLSAEELAHLNRVVKTIKLKKGDFIMTSGNYIKTCYSVISGIVREWRQTNDEEQTTEWYLADDILSDVQSINGQKPTELNWECITECVVSGLTQQDEEEMYRKFPRLGMLSRTASEIKFSLYRNRIQQYLASSPEQRYLNLLKERPEIISNAPQYQIASYIGVKPESLSRIKSRMSSMV